MSINISIADDHPMIINGLRNMLSDYKHINILASYANGKELLEGLKTHIPDVLLLDIQMPGQSGDELAPILLKQYPEMHIITLTNFDNALYVNSMLRHGVQGYLLKTTDPATLVTAIEMVSQGSQFMDPAIADKVQQLQVMKKDAALSPLTLREKDILQLVVNGGTTKEIATALHLSAYTVENYRAKLMIKLDVKNMAELTKKALILGLAK